MLHEIYLELTQLTYPEFVETYYSGLIKEIIAEIIVATLFFYLGRKTHYKLDPEDNRKLKQICRWEKRPMRYQVKHILEMFIEHYTNKNNINWNEVDH